MEHYSSEPLNKLGSADEKISCTIHAKNHELAAPYNFVRVNSTNVRTDLVEGFYNICKHAFNEHELESYDDWIYVLQNNYMTFFIIILHQNEVIGGVVYEVYSRSSCAMLTYVAIDEKYRGCGLSKRLLEETIGDIKMLNIDIVLVEVAVPNGNPDGLARQKIWSRLRFTPTDIVYTHPGYLRWKPYQVGVYNPEGKDYIEINKKTLESFLTEYFGQILEDDDDKSGIEMIRIVLNLTIDSDVVIAKNDKWTP